MQITVFSAHAFEQPYLTTAAQGSHELHFVTDALSLTTVEQAKGSMAVALFTSDDASAPILERLHALGVRYVAVRAVGHDQVDLAAAARLGLRVANVPEYSPYAVAEHAVALMLGLSRQLCRASNQLQHGDFRLDNLVGFDLHGKTVGIMGCGRIGAVMATILHGFGCRLLGADVVEDPTLCQRFGLAYLPSENLYEQADIISVHIPLTSHTYHLLDAAALAKMKPGVMLINTGRGGVLDTQAALDALKSGQLGYLGLDVYEHEKGLFFNDRSQQPLPETDPLLAELVSLPNVLVTGHQAFLTHEALTNIAATTLANINCWQQKETCLNELRPG
ncbi:2-hydroxyacid dehydrogenase [Hymenobacter sp. DG25A]|uniref:2-hydroxyacid dehydrogenase n=1 Tax=Hymenobacter sp. DG25A TaxID=1385663 RepID=UPI0006BDDEA7|nr:2-hydroxyacid dehydrogenase [Hymenobacter sp. DG25A]ALD21468.1 2-hydroxyacid dehydrogenase [Hymenobacter sp. DG25A]